MRALRLSFDGLWTVVAVALPAFGSLLTRAPTLLALVITDTRFEVVADDPWHDHIAHFAGRFDWRAIVDRRDPDLIVASRSEHAGLLEALASASDAGWREVHADTDRAALVQR